SRDELLTRSRKSLVLASNSLNPRCRMTFVARLRWAASTSQPSVKVNCPDLTLGPDSLTTCRLRLCGLPIPTTPMTRRSLADVFLAEPSSWAARSGPAYQAGSPAAASASSERCKKPRRDRFPRSTFTPPSMGLRASPLSPRGRSAKDALGEEVQV